jgi:predicted DCC family thiol-disulfide oxidoreductase YuxK
MKNGWTGGQYSLYRVVFGGYLLIHYLGLVRWGPELFSRDGLLPNPWASPLANLFPNILTVWDSGVFVQCLLVLAAGLSALLVIGLWDRLAGALLWYIGACFVGRNPLIANPALPYVGWLLLAHVVLPSAPYGSLAARGRNDPRGRWSMTPAIYGVAWLLMALGYSYSGLMKLSSPSWLDGSAMAHILANPLARPGLLHDLLAGMPRLFLQCATWGALALELTFAPLALIRRARPWIWSAMLLLHLGLLALIDFPDLTIGMVILHMFTFDPAWVPGMQVGARETVFYDGYCGLCHRTVRFVIAEDADGSRFRFAPLQGPTLEALVSSQQRAGLPDSMAVYVAGGHILTRSAALVHILGRLGGAWRLLGGMISAVPRPVRDAAYDFVARIRYAVFGRRDQSCPVVSPELRARFVDFVSTPDAPNPLRA